MIADCYKFWVARDDRPAGLDEGTGLQEFDAGRFVVRDYRPAYPAKKQEIIDSSQKRADRVEKNMSIGAITERERYNALLDIWAHCREEVTKQMLDELKYDTRDAGGGPMTPNDPKGIPYLNPVSLMPTRRLEAASTISGSFRVCVG